MLPLILRPFFLLSPLSSVFATTLESSPVTTIAVPSLPASISPPPKDTVEPAPTLTATLPLVLTISTLPLTSTSAFAPTLSTGAVLSSAPSKITLPPFSLLSILSTPLLVTSPFTSVLPLRVTSPAFWISKVP